MIQLETPTERGRFAWVVSFCFKCTLKTKPQSLHNKQQYLSTKQQSCNPSIREILQPTIGYSMVYKYWWFGLSILVRIQHPK